MSQQAGRLDMAYLLKSSLDKPRPMSISETGGRNSVSNVQCEANRAAITDMSGLNSENPRIDMSQSKNRKDQHSRISRSNSLSLKRPASALSFDNPISVFEDTEEALSTKDENDYGPEAQFSNIYLNSQPVEKENKERCLLSEKKLRRLEKNRISARECRRKKREAAMNLNHEINVLESENLRLRLQMQIGEEGEESIRQEQDRVTEELDQLLKSGASESAIYASIEDFKEKFADYGRDRRSAIEFHLKNVERLLMPTTTTSVAIRALMGGNISSGSTVGGATASFGLKSPEISTDRTSKILSKGITEISEPSALNVVPDSSSVFTGIELRGSSSKILPPLEPKALFHYLVKYLQVTPEQATSLKDSRHVAKELDSVLAKSLAVLEELRLLLSQCGEDLEMEFSNIRSILTPTQAAKFLVWVANNGACIHMLNELWSKVYQEPMVSPIHEDSVE